MINDYVKIRYTNYRHITSERIIQPTAMCFTSTEWHPEMQWILFAYDVSKHAQRGFAIKDIKSWRPCTEAEARDIEEYRNLDVKLPAFLDDPTSARIFIKFRRSIELRRRGTFVDGQAAKDQSDINDQVNKSGITGTTSQPVTGTNTNILIADTTDCLVKPDYSATEQAKSSAEQISSDDKQISSDDKQISSDDKQICSDVNLDMMDTPSGIDLRELVNNLKALNSSMQALNALLSLALMPEDNTK